MLKKSIVLGVISLAIAGVAAYSTGVFAYQGDAGQKGLNYTPERHEQMEKAFDNNDYGAWKELMNGRGRVTEVINEGNFNRFSEAHRLMAEGKTDEANQIRQELGLGQGDGNRQGRGMNNEQRGQNKNGNFIDANVDGKCDRV